MKQWLLSVGGGGEGCMCRRPESPARTQNLHGAPLEPLMTPMQHGTPRPPSYPSDMEASMMLPKQRASTASSLSSLPYRRSNSSLHKLFESTLSLSGSRPSSGTATPTPSSVLPSSTLSPGSRQNGTGTPSSLPPGVSDEYRTLIQRAFVPHVAVLADDASEALIRGKGLEGGLLQLLRPFGETVPGKITIRDSIGASKSHADFGIRFVDPLGLAARSHATQADTATRNSQEARVSTSSMSERRTGGDVAVIEDLVERHLQYSEYNSHGMAAEYAVQTEQSEPSSSPFYTLYLRRLLSGLPLATHETFAHPVASVIAVSSRNPNPTEEFRRLYSRQREGDLRLPQWVDNDHLRYYVLVHEEETGDIVKANQIYEQMKRHFGLNCHLLRLKSQQCISSDDDSVRLPTSQAVVPQMERNVATWNEQVLSRRRGISGRFMSLSKRWTPFGSSRSSSPAIGSSNSNYDPLQGFYRPDAPEALMRKLADYSFMLRDFKLALSTYDILRTDFNNDKAWRHYAGAAEMSALSALLSTAPQSTKTRAESIDGWIEAASYSYTDRQRSAAPYYALRTLALSLELLRLRSPAAADDAARWASRILEVGLVGPVGHALFTERVSACYAVRTGLGTLHFGSRRRKAAFWAVMAAESWFRLDKALQAEKCVDLALRFYGVRSENAVSQLGGVINAIPFPAMQAFIDELRQEILAMRLRFRGVDGAEEEGGHGSDVGSATLEVEQSVTETETETLDRSPRAHRKSLIGAVAPGDPLGLAGEGGRNDHFE
ncbi:hypothetical protein M011DRAFT_456392 [Sporormia fimetaria CBS 119925]|uniref:Uncharacterized protein n=1 Tax=Sporormia fimetaria CBS 119925 TaxID=1340428 RepID=A0A6A6VN01_9PLEO|nr:hypothetical protein M011DRAFT_456392 [Sporormia fimetaria CBS 119925]